ncbi:MAG TPA: adenylate kinase [Nitrospiraceae bacterium]|nr:adenylate kinase [Nitrospiraceae bacterium]
MRIVLLGAPGVGKGTQAERLAADFHRPKISTGDLLREAVRNKTELGVQAKQYMDQGKLVPDAVVIGIVQEKVSQPVCAKGFILDGFPRTVVQAEELSKMLSVCGSELERVVNFEVPREEIIRRLAGRRNCPKCQAVFHVDSSPPQKTGVCDRCGENLVQRSDDKRETVEARLKIYDEHTAPLIAYYRGRGLLSTLDGFGTVDVVYERLTRLLAEHGAT